MVLLVLRSVPLRPTRRSYILSLQRTQVPTGIIRISVSFEPLIALKRFGLICISDIQYCDGVRGALVVYDPFDPLHFFYDGKYFAT